MDAVDVASFCLQALAIAAFSITITRAKVFDGLRKRTKGKLRELLHCPYCISHYAAFLLTMSMVPVNLWASDIVMLIVYVFGLVGLSALVIGGIFRLLLWQESRIEDLEAELVAVQDKLKELI